MASGWRKSSRSAQGNCVEIRPGARGVDVRDSKNPAGGHLSVTANAWSAFLADLKAGQLDR